MNHPQKYLAQANRQIAELTVQLARQQSSSRGLTRASAQRWRSRCLMRSKEAFACSRSTGYFCSVAADHPAHCHRRTPRRAGACHDATGTERYDLLKRSLPPPTFCECCHGSLSGRSIPVRRRSILVIPKSEHPHPRHSCGRRIGLIDATDNCAIGEHIVIILAPLAPEGRLAEARLSSSTGIALDERRRER
jgi:hypothetical protein